MVAAVANCPREMPVHINDPAREVAEVGILKDQGTCERRVPLTRVPQQVDDVGVVAQFLQARGLATTGVVQSFSALLVHLEIEEYLYCKAPLAFRVLRMEHPPP